MSGDAAVTDMNFIQKLLKKRQPRERVDRMWRKIVVETRRSQRPRRTQRFVWAGVAVAAAVAVLVFALPRADSGPLKTLRGAPIPIVMHAEQSLTQEFSDGSTLRLEQQSEVRLIGTSYDSVRFAMRKGRSRFDIKPGGPRRWEVDCGDALVTVLGTAFVIDKNDLRTAVHVERGLVRVSGKGVQNGETELMAGDSLVVADEPLPSVSQTVASNETPSTAAAEETAATAGPNAPAVSEPSPPKASGVRAGDDSCNESFAAMGPDGFAERVRLSKRTDELFCLADAARRSGHFVEAAAPLKVIVERHRGDDRAGLAAYTLGRLYLEQLSSPQEALDALEDAGRLGVPEALREVLLVKKIKTLRLLGDPGAEKLARKYMLRYPEGRYLEAVRGKEKDN